MKQRCFKITKTNEINLNVADTKILKRLRSPFPTKADYNRSQRPLPKMERRFDFLDILDYLMLMESIGFFTSDFFGPRPNAS